MILQVRVMVGEPIPMDDLLDHAKSESWEADKLYTAITRRIERRMHSMHWALHVGTQEEAVHGIKSGMGGSQVGGEDAAHGSWRQGPSKDTASELTSGSLGGAVLSPGVPELLPRPARQALAAFKTWHRHSHERLLPFGMASAMI